MLTKSKVIQGVGHGAQYDIAWGQANSTCVLPELKVNKAEVNYLYINGEVSSVNIMLDGTMYPG
jgi:hypothetical protein